MNNNTTALAIKAIGSSKGSGFAIKVSNNLHAYKGVGGLRGYSLLFAAVITETAGFGVKPKEAEKRAKTILEDAGIYPLKKRVTLRTKDVLTTVKKFFRL